MRRRLMWTAMALAVLVGASEAGARWGLGLGDPPLTIRHPTIDYLFAPGCHRRFGNDVCFNEWSMRSPSGERFPILVLGDSVVNGGAQTDQRDLATSILSREAGVPVANISAASWGPGNLLAYTTAFGWFETEHIVIVVSSHDMFDLPDFAPDLGPGFPEHPPASALWEAVTRYAPQLLPRAATVNTTAQADATTAGPEAFRALVLAAREQGEVCVLFHHEIAEIGTAPAEAEAFRAITEAAGGTFAALDETPDMYRDYIHLNEVGQNALAAALAECTGR